MSGAGYAADRTPQERPPLTEEELAVLKADPNFVDSALDRIHALGLALQRGALREAELERRLADRTATTPEGGSTVKTTRALLLDEEQLADRAAFDARCINDPVAAEHWNQRASFCRQILDSLDAEAAVVTTGVWAPVDVQEASSR